MTYLTKQQIQEADDHEIVDVDVPEWGGTVRVRSFSGDERDRFEELVSARNKNPGGANYKGVRAFLVSQVIVDEAGDLMFSEEDVKPLGRKSSRALSRIFDIACQMNGLTKKDVEELEGNSESGQSDNSGSSSAAPSENPTSPRCSDGSAAASSPNGKPTT